MYRDMNGKFLSDEEVQKIEKRNNELMEKAENGDMSALLEVQFIFSDELYKLISKEEN